MATVGHHMDEGSRTVTYLSHACSTTTATAKRRNGKTQTRRSDVSGTLLTNISSAYSHSRTWVWLTGTACWPIIEQLSDKELYVSTLYCGFVMHTKIIMVNEHKAWFMHLSFHRQILLFVQQICTRLEQVSLRQVGTVYK